MRRQAGASIIEVLVAALILALGMLVLMGVEASSMQLTQLSQFQSDASRIGQNMADRIRANPNNVNAYALTTSYAGNDTAQVVPANCASSCSAQAFRNAVTSIDMAELRNQARLALPQGDIRIRLTNSAGVGTVVDVWVMWQQASTRSDANIGGTGCPQGLVSTNVIAQCQLTRFIL